MLLSRAAGPTHLSPVEHVRFAGGGTVAISNDRKGNTFKYFSATGVLQKYPKSSSQSSYSCMTLSDDGLTIGAKHGDDFFLVDVANGKQTCVLAKKNINPPLATGAEDRCIVIRGREAYVGYSTGEIIIWNSIGSSDRLLWDRRDEISPWHAITVSDDGTLVVAATDHEVVVWNKTLGEEPVSIFEHLSSEASIFLKLTPDNRFIILGRKGSIYILDIEYERIEEINKRDNLGTPVHAAIMDNYCLVGYDKGTTVMWGIKPGHSDFKRQVLVLQEHDDVLTKVLAVSVSNDGLTATTASIRMGDLIYSTWDIKCKEKLAARKFLLFWSRIDEPSSLGKLVTEYIMPVPEPMLYPGQLALVRAAIGVVRHIPCVVISGTGSVGTCYYNVMALPLVGPVEEGLQDFAGVRCTVSANDVKPLTESELSRNETREQFKKRTDLQNVASSRDKRYVEQMGAWDKEMCWRALRITKNSVVDAMELLNKKKGRIPDDKLDALLPEEQEEEEEEVEDTPMNQAEQETSDFIPQYSEDIEDDDI
eukprot:TRINITY_DN11836_c0_g2_i1.p1 TRINITY_DN11836_c0_g2~~TRINITY_DN11836_c0_g2_i1.p1  ORF type:complete len:549 (+),score=153.99 TRINITY_DN11836_c0_g2_i1:44-1648(+)